MLRNLHASIESWPLATPFRISRGLKTVAEVVTVELGEAGVSGWGEATPYGRYGETAESVRRQIIDVAPQVADGISRAALAELLPPGAARNAIDCAMWDLEARRVDADRTGAGEIDAAGPAPLVSAITLSLDRPSAMAAAAAAAVESGARLLKAKLDAREPGDCLRAIRAVAPVIPLIVDANEGWSLDVLQRLQPLLRELDVAFVEQPLPAAEDWRLEGQEWLVPLCADESCHSSADLERLAGRYGFVNVKLDKAGGLTEALRLIANARAAGFGVMAGCMICTSLAIAPAFRIATLADFADLDGPLWLRKDREGGVKLDNQGILSAPSLSLWGGPAMTWLLRN